MIKIRSKKRGNCPPVLNRLGENKLLIETTNNNTKYDANPGDYDSRISKWEIDTSIYGHNRIKSKLLESQYGKCAFCESNVASISYGDIEHYRPKKYWIQNEKIGKQGPGYYWLAYNYDNLIFACQVCNQNFKKNYFPIRRIEFRVRNHRQSSSLQKEKPFLINPAHENPRHLIRFSKAMAYGIDKNHRGKKTIEIIGLNRKGEKGLSDIYEMRLKLFQNTENTFWIANQPVSTVVPLNMINDAKQLMEELRSSRSQFSAMINDNFPL